MAFYYTARLVTNFIGVTELISKTNDKTKRELESTVGDTIQKKGHTQVLLPTYMHQALLLSPSSVACRLSQVCMHFKKPNAIHTSLLLHPFSQHQITYLLASHTNRGAVYSLPSSQTATYFLYVLCIRLICEMHELHFPTELFTMLKLQIPSIDVSNLHKSCRSTDFEPQKL